jgi:hypothetical protein
MDKKHKQNVSKTMGALFLLGLSAASIVVSINNFQIQAASAVSAVGARNAATGDDNPTGITQPSSIHSMNGGTVVTDSETQLDLALLIFG